MGYSEPRRREPLTVPFLDGRHAAAEGARMRRRHQQSGQCTGSCDACTHDAEARKEADDE